MTGKRSNLLRKRRRDSPLFLLYRLGCQKAVSGFCIDNCTKPSLFCSVVQKYENLSLPELDLLIFSQSHKSSLGFVQVANY